VNGHLSSLYVCYLSLDDPLVHTQVVAYLEGLAGRGHRIHLLTFETRSLSREERRRIREDLARRGIAWHSLRYHKRLSLLATAFDVACGIAVGSVLVRRHRLDAVHARSHVPAGMGMAIRRLTGCKLIFDIRGLMAEEYVDAGNWTPGSLPFRLVKWVEGRAKTSADGAVVLTHAVVPVLWGEAGRANLEVIPCCADVEAIERRRADRDRYRERLGLDGRTVLVYVGKFGGWYLDGEMVDFFTAARALRPDLHLLVLSQSDRALIEREAQRAGLPADAYTVASAPPEEVASYLAAADAGIAFIRQAPSKVSSSPTKLGEYLAAGLPTVATSGIGDVDRTLAADEAGVLVADLSPAGLERAAGALGALLDDPDAAARCRRTAARELSLRAVGIPRYDALYAGVAAVDGKR
jgi:glycosyltransferase involved in cell wall biosynthesis